MPTSPQYGSKEYWEQRYAQDTNTFEWYQDYAGLRNLIRGLVPLNACIMQIGVGLSQLQFDMAEDGYESITSIDTSEVSIFELRKLHRGFGQLQYFVADCRWMPEFDDDSYDVVLDKGTLDAILCGKDAYGNVANALAEIYRILRPGGILVLITYGSPSHRLNLLKHDPQRPFNIALYTLIKAREGAHPAKSPSAKATSSASSSETDLSSLEMPQAANHSGTRLVGPFDASVIGLHEDKLALLRKINEQVHYIYVCTKLEAPPPPPSSPPSQLSCEDAAQSGHMVVNQQSNKRFRAQR